jgi:ferric-dicitrate binding protein FerR (iron transport regulator)
MDEESWPAGTSPELVRYAQELAVSPDQVGHWVSFFAEHPQGRLAWEEIRRLWKAPKRRPAKAPPAASGRRR